MSGVRRVTAVVLAILVVIPAIAAAQASITGVVTDESGARVAGRHGRGIQSSAD